ncbi:MAG: DUF4395 domain-containing protein [Candidatus Hodarchaeales archaeon]
MIEYSLQSVDHNAIKVNQITIIILNIVAFVLNAPWSVAFITAIMLLGVLRNAPGFEFIYKSIVKPLKLLEPDILDDNPEPHRFAQLLGGVFLAVASLSLFLGTAGLGWGLVWLVVTLAALNAFGGFCIGCAFYYWLGRLKAPGFIKSPPPGTFPGMRPK